MRITERARRIEPFYVMEVSKAAAALAPELAREGRPMVFLNIGEPDFGATPLVQDAAARAIREGRTQYTQATGLPELRERISRWYGQRFGLDVPARRIVVTAGASAALQLACLALVEAGDEVLMPDPSYPCNQQFVNAAEGRAVLLPTTAASRFQLSPDQVRAHWRPQTRGVLLASPSNPTGTSIAPRALAEIHAEVRERGGITLLDEIYLGLSHDEAFGQSGLALGDDMVSVNSFSKYFCMTGWRLGWLVLPEPLVPVIERLAQHLFICPSTIAQHAALACFEPESIAEYERRRAEFRARRDWFIPQLAAVGLPVPVIPDGAFYAWADCSAWCERLGLPAATGSWDLAFDLMRRCGLAVTPGRDFGSVDTARFIRFSNASSMGQLQEAIARLRRAAAELGLLANGAPQGLAPEAGGPA
ncbi:MAG: pyridoxal phosphate-dependent aminotransferase [Ramlibacter sp.]|uniref:pyridoxal phosphate-dependent aminotransferase n=1 Tax=Ramlibacter sp. TaxID=1917967 RepID=UPI00260947EA|nr:pyridoxal phosphate-dependent aminotransferase [Ramlibacter sp.]MDH4376274.1 pyridoxal phosphate-dependent aminotransferase [Ramlibacter sp.]